MMFISINNPQRTEQFLAQRDQKSTDTNKQGLTIRHTYIPAPFATKIIKKAVPEYKASSGSDVINVDVSKAHNQFGIRGETLKKFQKIVGNKVREGLPSKLKPAKNNNERI
jgi:hypothetical protein